MVTWDVIGDRRTVCGLPNATAHTPSGVLGLGVLGLVDVRMAIRKRPWTWTREREADLGNGSNDAVGGVGSARRDGRDGTGCAVCRDELLVTWWQLVWGE